MNWFIMVDVLVCIGCCICEVVCVVLYQEQQNSVVVMMVDFVLCIWVIKEDSFIMVMVCYQCEDVLCVNVCLVQVICCDWGYIFVMLLCCIGCKSCMLVCLFGVMEVVFLCKKVRVIKCDLCWYWEMGLVCVEVCLIKVLQCMDVEKVQWYWLWQQFV